MLIDIVNTCRHPLHDQLYRQQCAQQLDRDGVLVLQQFITSGALTNIREEGQQKQHLAYYTKDQHNVYLSPPDPTCAQNHARNRQVVSSKGCITDDQIDTGSPLRSLYNAPSFHEFLCRVLGESALYPYADPLSSVNIHYANKGQELGWHFDNSSFAITLLINKPSAGGNFEYVRGLRDSTQPETHALHMNYEGVAQVLDGHRTPNILETQLGDLTLFRGKDALHRVTPTLDDSTRMLAVLAYNTKPNISLSESARLTFYGRVN